MTTCCWWGEGQKEYKPILGLQANLSAYIPEMPDGRALAPPCLNLSPVTAIFPWCLAVSIFPLMFPFSEDYPALVRRVDQYLSPRMSGSLNCLVLFIFLSEEWSPLSYSRANSKDKGEHSENDRWMVGSKMGWRDKCNSCFLQKHRDTVLSRLNRGLNVRLLPQEYPVLLCGFKRFENLKNLGLQICKFPELCLKITSKQTKWTSRKGLGGGSQMNDS